MSEILFSLVNKTTLYEMVESFYSCVHLPIQVIDEEGHTLLTFGESVTFCHLFRKTASPATSCEKMHLSASKRAIELGSSYIFSCHAHLNHIVFPLLSNQHFLGSILLGPFQMDEPDSTMVSDISSKYKLNIDKTLNLFEELQSVPIIPPKQVNQINKLLFYLFQNLITDSKEQFKLSNQILSQQSKLNEAIQRYKDIEPESNKYPYELERNLITKVKTGNVAEARAILNDLLGYVLFSEGNNLEFMKLRAVELCGLLSRSAIESGAPANNVLKLNDLFLQNSQQIKSMDILCIKLQEIVEAFTESMFQPVAAKGNELIKKSLNYISLHFNEPLTLEMTADYVHLHPAYFSTIFKQYSGTTFKEYLNTVRIEESKRLLSNTDYSILDIALACGFDTQSYFSKVFKKYTGITPKQFR